MEVCLSGGVFYVMKMSSVGCCAMNVISSRSPDFGVRLGQRWFGTRTWYAGSRMLSEFWFCVSSCSSVRMRRVRS